LTTTHTNPIIRTSLLLLEESAPNLLSANSERLNNNKLELFSSGAGFNFDSLFPQTIDTRDCHNGNGKTRRIIRINCRAADLALNQKLRNKHVVLWLKLNINESRGHLSKQNKVLHSWMYYHFPWTPTCKHTLRHLFF